MNMNPAAVATDRAQRLAREARTPVYTTRTGDAPRKAPKGKDPVVEKHYACVHSIGYCGIADWD